MQTSNNANLELVNRTICWTLAGPLTDWQGPGTDARVRDGGCWIWGWVSYGGQASVAEENGEVGVGD